MDLFFFVLRLYDIYLQQASAVKLAVQPFHYSPHNTHWFSRHYALESIKTYHKDDVKYDAQNTHYR